MLILSKHNNQLFQKTKKSKYFYDKKNYNILII